MPTYVYACQGCGARLERRQSFSDSPLSECEACGGELRRVLQPVGIIFRGSGFYTTDYGRKDSSSAEGSATKAPAQDGGSKDTEAPKAEPSTTSTTTTGSTPATEA